MKHIIKGFMLMAIMLSAASTACSETVVVTAKNYEFSPKVVTVNKGDSVKWVIEGTFHSTTSGTNCEPDGIWYSEVLVGGDTYSREFKKTGTYPYYCTPHCDKMGMTGTVIVK